MEGTLSDRTLITYNTDGSYVIIESDGSDILKASDGSYAIVLASGTYVITEATGNIETGNNSDTLDDYLEENDYPTLSEYDEQVQDIVDYVNENS